MAERLELVLQAFEHPAFTAGLSALQEAQQAQEKAERRLWKMVYNNRKDYHSSDSETSMATEYAISYAEDMLDGKELKRHAALQQREDELEEKKNDFTEQCADEALQLDDISRWAIGRHIRKAMNGRDVMLGNVMTSLGHVCAVDRVLKDQRHELLTVFSQYGVITAALNDGEGLRMSGSERATLTATPSYSLGILSLTSRDMLITNPDMSLEMRELDTGYGVSTGNWADILKLGQQRNTDLPPLIFGDPVNGPRTGDRHRMPENDDFYDDMVEKARLVAALAVGTITLDDPSLQRFEINPVL